MVSSLLNAEIDGDRLSEEEVIANCIITMIGGQETTTNLIASGTLTLLRNPAELAKLRGNLSLIPSAVEELLRYESPVQHTARLAPEDTVLDGKHIRKRQAVIAVMAAANRDPAVHPDPDRFDVERELRHVAFGTGPHVCVGLHVAKLEMKVLFEELLPRIKGIELTGTPRWLKTNFVGGLRSMPVRLVKA